MLLVESLLLTGASILAPVSESFGRPGILSTLLCWVLVTINIEDIHKNVSEMSKKEKGSEKTVGKLERVMRRNVKWKETGREVRV